MYRYAVSRTFSPGAVEVVRGRGHALPPPQFRGQGQDTTFTKNRGQVQDSPSSQRSVIVHIRYPTYSISLESHILYILIFLLFIGQLYFYTLIILLSWKSYLKYPNYSIILEVIFEIP